MRHRLGRGGTPPGDTVWPLAVQTEQVCSGFFGETTQLGGLSNRAESSCGDGEMALQVVLGSKASEPSDWLMDCYGLDLKCAPDTACVWKVSGSFRATDEVLSGGGVCLEEEAIVGVV